MFDRLLGVHVGWILISPLDNPSFGESTQDKSWPSQLKKNKKMEVACWNIGLDFDGLSDLDLIEQLPTRA
jgi:hypothetical protein